MEDLKEKFPDQELFKILRFISEKRGVDLSSYRRTFVDRHLRSRLMETHSGNAMEYIALMKDNPEELDKFLDALSINVTHFFRDKDVFESLKEKIIPDILKGKDTGTERKLIRVWSAACASGQEPYSIAMLLDEAVRGRDNLLIRIWATDVDQDALDKAKEGRYDEEDIKEVPPRFIDRYFIRDGGMYVVKDELKSLVRFEKHNLITGEPLKFMDAVFCRNVMIYFNREQQEALMAKFAAALNSKGYLVIAKVESVWEKDLFVPVDHIRKIYRKIL
ncbi:MAG: CheR family methyltransferase [Deltaproteobacteria bacterium]